MTGAVRFKVLVANRPDFASEGHGNFMALDRRQDLSAKPLPVSCMLAGFVELAALGLARRPRRRVG